MLPLVGEIVRLPLFLCRRSLASESGHVATGWQWCMRIWDTVRIPLILAGVVIPISEIKLSAITESDTLHPIYVHQGPM